VVITTEDMAKKAAEAKARLEAEADKLRLLFSKGGCVAFVGTERASITVDVAMDYFGQAQAIIRANKIACIVRPY